jgi:2-C-methyl-D-erythritol 4-phosphate cytidylyltransferase
MAPPPTDVEAIIQAAGQGTRLGRGPKAFVMLAGSTLLERAVATMLPVSTRVTVAVPAADVERARRLVGDARVSVIAGGARRTETLRALVAAATAPWLVLHDVVHPLTTVALARRVLARARRCGSAAAALPTVEFLYGTDGVLRAAPGEALSVQKPVAFRREVIARGFALAGRSRLSGDPSVLELLALAGVPAEFVPGHRANLKLTTADDLEFARALVSHRDRPASGAQ